MIELESLDNVWFKGLSDQIIKQLIEFREDLHRHPELSLEEYDTSRKVQNYLKILNPASIEVVAGTGVVARFSGNGKSTKVIGIRGDMDALPINEETKLPYKSVVPGVMHACGHDVHTTWVLAALHHLEQQPPDCDYIAVFQPAEEVTKGAKLVLASGALDNVDFMLGGHVDPNYTIGQIVVQPGAISASSDTFRIRIKGRGAHGARPHEGSDPIVALAELIMSLNSIVSRRINPDDKAVVSIGTISSGKTHNVIPEQVDISGTIRAVHPDTQNLIFHRMDQICKGVALSCDVEIDCDITKGNPVILNKDPYIGWLDAIVRQRFGEKNAVRLKKANMGGEDFAQYLETIPGIFFRVGTRYPDEQPVPAHTPLFNVNHETIFTGGFALAEAVRYIGRKL